MDDRPLGTDSTNREATVQSKEVLSYAMTLMDRIRRWEEEESWVGSKFAACMWKNTKEALTGGQILDRVQEAYLRKIHEVHYALHGLGLWRRFRQA